MDFKKYKNPVCKPIVRSPSYRIRISLTTIIVLLLCPLCLLSCTTGGAKNIILMVPDGMGLADVTAARIHKHAMKSVPLCLESLDHIGYQRTLSADNIVMQPGMSPPASLG